MPGYVIVDVDVHDAEGYHEYGAMVEPSIEAFGGRFLVRGGRWERKEGDSAPKRLVVIEFPSADMARRAGTPRMSTGKPSNCEPEQRPPT